MKKLLTFVVPCYNESDRLQIAKENFTDFFLDSDMPSNVVFVNDGSTDDTEKKLYKISKEINVSVDDEVARVISYKKNRGKGYALKTGIDTVTTDWVLTIDADMAAKPQEILSWKKNKYIDLHPDHTIYIGSREKGFDQHMVKSKFVRRKLGLAFSFFTQTLTGLPFRDTQCGFKLYPTSIAREVFNELEDYGFAHDVEVLVKLQQMGITITSLPLHWQHVSGSKVNVFKDSIKMLHTVVKVRKKYKTKV